MTLKGVPKPASQIATTDIKEVSRYAAAALSGLIASATSGSPDELVKTAFTYAIRMLEVRKQQTESNQFRPAERKEF